MASRGARRPDRPSTKSVRLKPDSTDIVFIARRSSVTALRHGEVFGLAAAAIVFTCASAWAQATATISGTARDQSGAVLPGVTITVTQQETGLIRTTVSNDTGSYVLPNLPLG